MKAPDEARGAVVTVIGPPESGKSELLWQLYTRHEPRVLTIEVVPETERRLARLGAGAAGEPRRTYGLERTLVELRAAAGAPAWHIVASLEHEAIEALLERLVPIERDGPRTSFAKAVGGMTLACNELSYFAPRSLEKDSAVRRAYVMYRHHWLSLHGAVQHAPDCWPAARLSADRVVFLRNTDDLALEAIARASSHELARRVEDLPQFHSLTFIKSRGRAYVADGHYAVYDVLDHRGRSLSSDADSPTPGLSPGAAQSAGADADGRPAARTRQARA